MAVSFSFSAILKQHFLLYSCTVCTLVLRHCFCPRQKGLGRASPTGLHQQYDQRDNKPPLILAMNHLFPDNEPPFILAMNHLSSKQ